MKKLIIFFFLLTAVAFSQYGNVYNVADSVGYGTGVTESVYVWAPVQYNFFSISFYDDSTSSTKDSATVTQYVPILEKWAPLGGNEKSTKDFYSMFSPGLGVTQSFQLYTDYVLGIKVTAENHEGTNPNRIIRFVVTFSK